MKYNINNVEFYNYDEFVAMLHEYFSNENAINDIIKKIDEYRIKYNNFDMIAFCNMENDDCVYYMIDTYHCDVYEIVPPNENYFEWSNTFYPLDDTITFISMFFGTILNMYL